jgi:parvulin-like peptidyl-prolyl isomerase
MRRLLIALTAVATLASLAACGSSPSAGSSDSQAATVNGTPVSLDSYNTLSTTLRQRIERQTGGSFDTKSAAGAQRLAKVQAAALRQLVSVTVLQQLAAQRHVNVSDADVDAATTRLASALGGQEQLALRLGDNGVGAADARQAIRLILLEQHLRGADPGGWDKAYTDAIAAARVVAFAAPCQANHSYPDCLGGN